MSWGAAGEERAYRLELRLLADAGLVGYPNVGKSTLISRLSAARPKIADYAFTTLEPNLGVVSVGEWPHEQSFTVADLPGLIEGAHLGAGLGIQFLKHIERTSVIVHLVDVSDSTDRPSPVDDFKVITEELRSFDPALAERPTVVVATKADVANPEKLKKLTAMAKRRKLPFYAISAVTGEGVDALKYALADMVTTHRPVRLEAETVAPPTRPSHPPPPSSGARAGDLALRGGWDSGLEPGARVALFGGALTRRTVGMWRWRARLRMRLRLIAWCLCRRGCSR